jgi:hypothetical protein
MKIEVLNVPWISDADGYMQILMDEWDIKPPSWTSSDPCDGWEGIKCTNSRITAM